MQDETDPREWEGENKDLRWKQTLSFNALHQSKCIEGGGAGALWLETAREGRGMKEGSAERQREGIEHRRRKGKQNGEEG